LKALRKPSTVSSSDPQEALYQELIRSRVLDMVVTWMLLFAAVMLTVEYVVISRSSAAARAGSRA
jgi:hypothetical protein